MLACKPVSFPACASWSLRACLNLICLYFLIIFYVLFKTCCTSPRRARQSFSFYQQFLTLLKCNLQFLIQLWLIEDIFRFSFIQFFISLKRQHWIKLFIFISLSANIWFPDRSILLDSLRFLWIPRDSQRNLLRRFSKEVFREDFMRNHFLENNGFPIMSSKINPIRFWK